MYITEISQRIIHSTARVRPESAELNSKIIQNLKI